MTLGKHGGHNKSWLNIIYNLHRKSTLRETVHQFHLSWLASLIWNITAVRDVCLLCNRRTVAHLKVEWVSFGKRPPIGGERRAALLLCGWNH